MGLSAAQIKEGLDAVAKRDKRVKAALKAVGYPTPRSRPRGYNALLRTLVAQQISIKAAASIYAKLEAGLGDADDPTVLLAASEEDLRSYGLSRQKVSYAQSLAQAVVTGQLDFKKLKKLDDDAAIAMLSSVKGFGRWSAEIYLLFAEGRPDIWPADDLAIMEGVRRLMGLAERPKPKATRELAEPWAPYRGAMAVFTWHYYANSSPI
jgi:DNA-3-methyladenine glycosylase II